MWGVNYEPPVLSESEINFRVPLLIGQLIYISIATIVSFWCPLLLVGLFYFAVAVTTLACRLAKCLVVMFWSVFWILENIIYHLDVRYSWLVALTPVLRARGTARPISPLGRAIICLLFLLLAVPSTDAIDTPPTVDQYNLLRAHIPQISQWFQYFGGLLHRYGHPPYYQYYQATIEEAKQRLLYHLRYCIPILAVVTGVWNVLRESAARESKKRKRGRKSASDKRAFDEMVMIILIGFFQDKKCPSVRSYLAAKRMDFLRFSVQTTINSNDRLKYIMMRDRRKCPRLVKEALDIIRGIGDSSNKENVDSNCENTDNVNEFAEDRTIYDFQALKRIADGLDFQTRPRVSRDGKHRPRPPLVFCHAPSQLIVVFSAKDQNISRCMAKSTQPRL